MASDYSFAQFRYLSRLLLLHGRATYLRNCEVVLYSFYKNWIYNMVLLFYGFYMGGLHICMPCSVLCSTALKYKPDKDLQP